jgi:hypothetical protein
VLTRHLPALTLVAAVTLVATALATARAETRAEVSSNSARTIASTTTSDFRVVVTVKKVSEGPAPAARVTVRTYERAPSGWHTTGARVLAETYFWKTLIGPRAVCRVEIRTAGGAGSTPRAIVQLLQSPSLGCGQATSHRLT